MNYELFQARQSIYFSSYIFHSDETGLRIARLLARKATEGVDVRLFLDAWGSLKFNPAMEQELIRSGVKIIYFRPFQWWRPYRHLLRNHRRLMIVDGKKALTGGLAIQNAWADVYPDNEVQDIQLWLEGPIVRRMGQLFMHDWCQQAREQALPSDCSESMMFSPVTAPASQTPESPGTETTGPALEKHSEARIQSCTSTQMGCNVLSAMIITGPGKNRSAIHRFFLKAMRNARERIWLATPYFVPDAAFLQAMIEALNRGVDVRLISASENRIEEFPVNYLRNPYFEDLLSKGGRIFIYDVSFLHSKAALLDDVAIIGTSNLDRRSFDFNHEVDIVLYDPGMSEALTRILKRYMQNSREVSLEAVQDRSTSTRCLEWVWWPLIQQF